MAQPLQSINLVAPAFKGVNTEDSPLTQDPSFAAIADNAVIDKRGRIASRKGLNVITTDKVELSSDYIHKLHYFYDDAGNTKLFSVGNNKILSGTTTLVDETPAAYAITANNWKMVNFNSKAYFFQRGQEPLVYDDSTGLRTIGTATGTTTDSRFYCHEALAAYGRLWITNNETDSQTIYWSDLLDGIDFYGGSSGSINVSKSWPNGHDEIRALAAHNNLLIIFGEHSIIVYQNAFSPALMTLVDTVAGIGCVCRNSVQHIGTDVLFLSQSGLRSFGRTVQEKSMPIGDLSSNIKTEFVQQILNRTAPTSSAYSPENSFYLITLPDQNITYCFDLKGQLENGAYRVTVWPSNFFKSYERTPDGTLYIGSTHGVGEHAGYQDNGESYRFRYYSPGLTFGDPSKLKILKKLRPTIIGANNAPVFINWAYDLQTAYKTQTYTVGDQQPSYYNVNEYVAYSELVGLGITASQDGNGVWVVNKYLGEFSTDPTTGVGGGALADGDSYFNVVNDVYYVYLSSEWKDVSSLTVSASSQFTGGELASRRVVNATGDGTIITIGMETDVDGFPLSLQEINVLVLIGKTI